MEFRPKGYAALAVMEQHLEHNKFFAGSLYSIADIALFAYTHVAEEGEYSLDDYPAITAWIDRVIDQPEVSEVDGLMGCTTCLIQDSLTPQTL